MKLRRTAPPRLGPPRRFGLLVIGALTVPLLVLGAFLLLAWRDTWRSAERELARGAEAAAEYALRVIDIHRLAGDLANHLLQGLSDEEIRAQEGNLHRALRELLPTMPGVLTLAVLSREAEILLTANIHPVPRGVRVPDREWVTALREPDAPALHISAVVVGRLENNVFFGVSRRRTDTGNGLPPGAFDGVVNVSVDPNQVSAGLAAIAGWQGDVTSLVRADGALLARSAGFPIPPPQIPAGSRLRDLARGGAKSGTYMGETLGLGPDLPGEARLIAFRQVGELPVYATLARPTTLIVDRWRETMLLQLAVGLPAWAVLAGFALLLRRSQRDLSAANAELEQRVAARTAALLESEAEARRTLEQLDVVYATAPVGLCAFDTQGRFLRVNAALAEINGVPAEAHIGRTIRDVVPGIADAGEALLRSVLETGQAMLGVEIEGETPAQPGVKRAWVENWSPIRDALGRITGVSVVAREVTAERAAARALAESAARLRDSATRLSTLVNALPLGVGLSDLQGRLLVSNAALRRFVPEAVPSRDPARQHRWRGHDRDGQRIPPSDYPVARALRGETVLPGLDVAFTEEDGTETWTRVGAAPLRDDEGGVVGAVLLVADITAQKAAEEHRELLMREVDHRAKNALAVVQAALRLTRKDDPEAFAQAIEGRVAALARAHSVLAAGKWQSAALRELVEAELATFRPEGARHPGAAAPEKVTVEGPDLSLAADAVQALSMALHELATNAAKYGALSTPKGRVAVSWHVDRAAGLLALTWRERGGPPVAEPPAHRGFGSRVIEATVTNQLGGKVVRRWEAEGLVCEIAVPTARVLVRAPDGTEPGAKALDIQGAQA